MGEAGPGCDGVSVWGGGCVRAISQDKLWDPGWNREKTPADTLLFAVATAVCFDVLTSVLMGLIQLSVSDTAAAAAAAKSLNAGTLSIYSFRDEQRLYDELHFH